MYCHGALILVQGTVSFAEFDVWWKENGGKRYRRSIDAPTLAGSDKRGTIVNHNESKEIKQHQAKRKQEIADNGLVSMLKSVSSSMTDAMTEHASPSAGAMGTVDQDRLALIRALESPTTPNTPPELVPSPHSMSSSSNSFCLPQLSPNPALPGWATAGQQSQFVLPSQRPKTKPGTDSVSNPMLHSSNDGVNDKVPLIARVPLPEPEPEPEPTPAGRRGGGGGGGGILATSSAMLSQHAGAASGPSASYIYSERGSAATAPPHTRIYSPENTISNPPGGGGSSRLRPGLEIELPGRASRDSSSVAAGDIRSRALAPAGQSAGVLTVPHLQRAGHPMPSAITAVHTMRSGNLDHSHPVADTTEAEPPAAAPRPQLGGSGSHMALAGAAQGLAGAITTAHAMRSSLDHSHPLADTTTATGDFFEL